MCGIAGIISLSPSKVDILSLKKMTDTLAHRGPDGEGQWVNDLSQVGLGHRRLSIIDLSYNANQPMHYLNKYTIVFNGEIYNYLELKQSLITKGYKFQTDSDTEVLLALYSDQKENLLSLLDGMFAFAIWDNDEKVLFCARDRFGEKPFYYYKNNDSFYFASEMKALWAIGIPKIPNEETFSDYIHFNKSFNERNSNETFYKNIYKLEHSHWMKIRNGEIQTIKKYYDINWENQNFKGTIDDATEEFRRLFNLSLQRRLRSDVPIGTSLSGGLDSSSIVCNLSPFLNNKNVSPHTFSARFDGYKKNEGFFIEKVIQKTNAIPHYIYPSGKEFKLDFEKLCWHQEEPFGSSSIYAQYRVQQLAKNNNITVLIDGQGADEILAGYLFYYTYYLQSLQYKSTTLDFRKIEQNAYLDFHTPHIGLKKKLIKWTSFYELLHKFKSISNKEKLSLNYFLYQNTMKGGLQELLRFADRNSMAHGREVRLPFLNHELVELCFSLPDEYKLYQGWTKYVMRKAFNDVLPNEIAWRKDKIGFESPQDEWMIEFENSSWKDLMLKQFYNA